MQYLGFTFITIGAGFIITGIVGLFRFCDFFTKIHASSVIESCGVPFCLLGLCFLQTDFTSAFKLIIIICLMLLLNPVSTYALARASLVYKIDEEGRMK